jgi:hypothetical protein
VSLTTEDDVVLQIERILTDLAQNRDRLERLRQQGMYYAQGRLTWDAKATTIIQIMRWAMGRGPKPDLPPPKTLAAGIGYSR